jgi:hypothetical protein
MFGLKRRKFFYGVGFILAWLGTGMSLGWAATHYVSTSGSNSNDGSLAHPWATLAYAESQLSPGDTVMVKGGDVFNPSSRPIVTINVANTHWTAYGTGSPIIDGNETGCTANYVPLVKIIASGVSFEGFAIQNSNGRGMVMAGVQGGTINACSTTNTWNSGLVVEESTGVIVKNCDFAYGAKDYILHYWSTTTWPATLTLINSQNCWVTQNCVHDSYFEGFDIIRGAEGNVIEYNECYGNQRLQFYLSNSRGNVLRFNLIYGTGTGHDGVGIWLGGENAFSGSYPSPAWNTNNMVYGNMVANTRCNLRVGGESTAYETGAKVYNNTLVECSGSGAAWQTNVYFTPVTGTGHLFKNNLILQSANPPVIVETAGVVTASNNLWSRPQADIDADIQGTASLFNVNPQLAKSSGWSSLTSGSCIPDNFKVLSGSPALNQGASLGAAYNRDYWGTTRPQGAGWDIGAHEFVTGVGTPTYTSTRTPTPTFTMTQTRTFTHTATRVLTATSTQTLTWTPTLTYTATQTYTPVTQTPVNTPLGTGTLTPPATATFTHTPVLTQTPGTATPTFTAAAGTPGATRTPTVPLYITMASTPTRISTPIPTASPGIAPGKMRAYPNPAQDRLRLEVGTSETRTVTVRFYAVSGALVLSATETVQPGNGKMDLDLRSLANGVYFYCVDGEGTQRGKIAVNR